MQSDPGPIRCVPAWVLLVLEDNPLDDLTALERIAMRFKQGEDLS